ncbi:MAG TPA: HAD family hydrolase [Candidatus Limnocylindrales bacterium]|nr:HAD family hydrolase [Candidatus Limnocylindrales bacterium]
MIQGILFDVDGTLVDSNDQHAHSWVEAFAAHGYDVPYEDVRRLIGMGGDKLIQSLQPGLNDEEGVGKEIKELRSKTFLEKYAPTLKPTNGARDLVLAVQGLGLQTMVASSAKQDELDALLTAANVQDLLTEATTSDDAENSKPDPDIIHVALNKIGLKPSEVGMIGDTPYDIEAATKAGVACVVLRSGGWSDRDLSDAFAIYNDPADLLAHRDDFGL